MKDEFLIQGLAGKRLLKGEIPIRGSKNAVLPAMASSFLFSGPILLHNVPHIEDVLRMSELMSSLGAKVSAKNDRTLLISPESAHAHILDTAIAKRFRASILLSGPLLSRFGKVVFPYPGGCVIGKRPIDLFLQGFKKMGARVLERDEHFTLFAPKGKLSGADIFFKIQSVTVSETFIMAAVLARGVTVLRNVALEPEVTALAQFLLSNGARIEGIGTTTLKITGGAPLSPKHSYDTIPDRIETGSFLLLGALSSDNLLISDCKPDHVRALIDVLRESGVIIKEGKDTLHVRGWKKANTPLSLQIKTHEYPGFPTDLQAPLVVFFTQCKGENLVFETIFEGRLSYIEDLKRMGADIVMWDTQRALIKGVTPLKGRELDGPDIRAGLAFLIAAIVARGSSIINNVYYIDRGYERIEERLSAVGVSIERRKKAGSA